MLCWMLTYQKGFIRMLTIISCSAINQPFKHDYSIYVDTF